MAYALLGSAALLLLCVLCTAQKAQNDCGPPPRRDREELADLSVKESYSHDEQVLYNCRPGYIKVGRFRMRCNNGRWEQMPPFIECRRKPCGHPGDIQSGSFDLVEGEDFSFGARVVYQCDEGYKMLSHANYRECRADGWSNDVPHCEITKCYPVREPQNGKILMTGIMDLDQDFLYGHLLRFECNEHFKIKGSNQIVCTSDGNWSEDVPTCIEITCEADSIPHGSIRTSKTIYKDGERIQIDCKEGYKPADRNEATCTGDGWNPRLECIEIVCSPPQILNGNFEPEQLQYEYQESIDTLCGDGYKSSGTSICTARGWQPPPACIPKQCEYPRIPNGQLYYGELEVYFPKRVGHRLDFRCDDGFLASDKKYWQTITCTKNGWNPEPKCFRKCDPGQEIEHGILIYSWWAEFIEGNQISLHCNMGYYPEHQQTTVKCTKNGWSPTPRCVPQKETPRGCQNISPPNGFFTERRNEFSLNENVHYRCQSGYTTPNGNLEGYVKCLETGWSPEPKCIKTCERPSEENAVFDKDQSFFFSKETLHYECKEGFQTTRETTSGHIQCTENGWDPKPLCLPIECEAPFLEHGSIQPRKDEYMNRDVVKFSCMRGYTRVGPEVAQCYHFGWSPQPPICKEKVNNCQQPPSILNGFVTGDLLEEYQHGEKVFYECDVQFTMAGSNTVECVDGEWISLPSCTEKCKYPKGARVVPDVPLSKQFNNSAVLKYRCGSSLRETKCINGKWLPEPECKELCPPPPQLPNAINVAEIRNYKNGEEVDFTCMEHFLLQGPSTISCEYGSWQTPPRCVDVRCPPPPDISNGQINGYKKQMYLPSEKVHYHCLPGYNLFGSPVITCLKKQWTEAPQCREAAGKCDHAPSIENGGITEIPKREYSSGEIVHYKCQRFYSMEGNPAVHCLNGHWSETPRCLEKPCGKPPIIDHASYLEQVKNKYDPGETVNFECHDGFAAEGPLSLTCQGGEWSEPSTCEDATCGEPPVVENADIVEDRAEVYPSGHELHYQCYEGFEISGPNTVRCENKVWSESPSCEDVRCPSPPDIPNGRINGYKKQIYLPHEKVRYRCLPRYSLFGSPVITCSKKQWTEVPQCRETQGKCDRPPSIENGDTTEMVKAEYSSGDRVQYKCQRYYTMEGNPVVSCLNGHWSETPRCIVPCTSNEEDMLRNNIKLKWSIFKKIYTESGDMVEFECRKGYRPVPSSPPFRAQCIDRTFEYPQCI